MKTPARLGKVEERSYVEVVFSKLEFWMNQHVFLVLVMLFAVLLVLFICLVFAITGVSATESGMLRNFLVRGV